jgi:protein O-GlcNAc transferase
MSQFEQAKQHFLSGMDHLEAGNFLAAEDALREANALMPNRVSVVTNLSAVLLEQNKLSEAKAFAQQAVTLDPNNHQGWSNLGYCSASLGESVTAVPYFRKAIEIQPDYVEAYSNLGNTLVDLGRLEEAEVVYRQALNIRPDYADAHSNLGNTLMDLGRLKEAEACYQKALKIEPDFTSAHSNLLFLHNYLADQPTATLLAGARRFGELVAQHTEPTTDWPNPPDADKCLRVGLMSGDLRAHPVGYFMEAVADAIATADGKMELIAYPTVNRSDAVTERIKDCCQEWHSAVGIPDELLAQCIRDDGIDILIDLAGHTAHNRLPLFAWHPAPVQASWLGYFATTGMSDMDYLIADPWTVPKGEEAHFTETVWRLPETYLCFTPPPVDVEVAPLPALANGYITFGCFNNLTKMNDNVVTLWVRVLQAVPGSRLFLKTKQLGEATVRQSVIDRFAHHAIAAERLILEGASPRAELLGAYNRVDMALDPFPYPGGTTSVEALWMGVPVLTLAGDRFLSHIGESIQHNAGLPDWIGANADDYVVRAASHAADLQRLSELRKGLRQQVLASPLFDAQRFAHHFEAALRGMWTRWCDQQQGRKQ